MILPFKEGDEAIWVPVAKGKGSGPARAFLPFNGLLGRYLYGYKASPANDQYFVAVAEVQMAFIDDENQMFSVNGGKTEECQWRARWRHGNEAGSPLLGPTRGWVLVPLEELDRISGIDLGRALDDAGDNFAELKPERVESVLCESPEALERESALLFREASRKKSKGQSAPARLERPTEHFVRDPAVVAFVLQEADRKCESCLRSAPVTKPNGLPYPEVHHVKRLASGGFDKISNAIGVCPNCHRELHYGSSSAELAEILFSRINRLMPE